MGKLHAYGGQKLKHKGLIPESFAQRAAALKADSGSVWEKLLTQLGRNLNSEDDGAACFRCKFMGLHGVYKVNVSLFKSLGAVVSAEDGAAVYDKPQLKVRVQVDAALSHTHKKHVYKIKL